MNGIMRSVSIVDPTGTPAPSSSSWKAPSGSSPYFGWLGDEGFTTLRIDAIDVVAPHPQMRGRSIVFMKSKVNVVINESDACRLLKRMGWVEPGGRQ